jgi:hypothetical protein
MFGGLLGKLVSAPIRIVNIPIKVAKATGDFMCGETNVRVEDNTLDNIADSVEKSAKKILD